jgi:pimeloyl-ACP methyl ester carboxylesterase
MGGVNVDLQHRYVAVNGIRMHYVEAGAGETVLFLHGFPENWYSWRQQLEAFAPEYHVVAPDMRGYNETENQGPYDTGTLQQDVLELIDSLGVERVHLVAHDWGAAVAWLFAMNHGDRLKSLTICNVPHPAIMETAFRNPRQLMRSWYIFFFQLPLLPEWVTSAKNYQWMARQLIRDCRPGTFTRDDIKFYLEAWRRQGLGGGINWYRALFRNRPTAGEPEPVIETPTLFIWGENDRALGKELTYGTEQYVRNLQMEYLPGISHWVQQEAAGEVNRLLGAHLAANGSNA